MNKTLSFVRLDCLTIKPYLTFKTLAVLIMVILFVSLGTSETSSPAGILIMYSTIFAAYPLAVGDKSGIDTLYATLPVNKKSIVSGRYIFTQLLNILAGAVSLLASFILSRVLDKGFDFKETLAAISILLFIFSVMQAVQLPIYFKMGYAKAKFLAYLPIALIPLFTLAISSYAGKEASAAFLNRVFLWAGDNVLLSIALIAALWIIIMLCSVLLSYRFYKNREF